MSSGKKVDLNISVGYTVTLIDDDESWKKLALSCLGGRVLLVYSPHSGMSSASRRTNIRYHSGTD
jgi:hypothetical protein